MSKSCQLSVSHINIVRDDENLLATEETSTPTLYTYFRNFNDSRRNWYPSFYSDAGNGKTRHDISHKTARLSRLSFRRARHQRPGGICSLVQLVVRDALHLAMSETWELGTS